MAVRIRVDDFPGTKPNEFHKHNLENFKKFHEVMTRVLGKKKYLLGVIPKHTSDEDLKWLGQQENILIGLHGINHDERFPNEFREFQTTKERVKELLVAINRIERVSGKLIGFYIPPHNVMDNRTADACDDLGLPWTSGPETEDNLRNIHSEPPLEYGRSDELLQRGSVEYLLRTNIDPVYLTLHWPWEWNIGLEHLEIYLWKIAHVVEDWS